jgi:hypothetical protein
MIRAAFLLLAPLLLVLAACNDSSTPTPPTPTEERAVSTPAPAAPIPSLDLPSNDPIALAARYRKTDGPAATSKPFGGEPMLGSTRAFVVSRITGAAISRDAPPETVTVSATLHAISPHAYFYADDAIEPDREELQSAADKFEATAWPQITAAFGEPLSPGVDGDPRIIVLQADLGGAVGGYFSGDDAYLRAVRPQSNEAEMVYLDRTLRPGGNTFNSVLAHELQHLIHHANDRSEDAWVNEGMSEAALVIAGGARTSLSRFGSSPETQLNDWPSTRTRPHYGAGAAFFGYVAHQLGREAILGEIAREPADSVAGVERFVSSASPSSSFRAMFADWIVANIVNLDEGPYANPSPLETHVQYELAPGDVADSEAHQFGTDYYALTDIYGEEVGDFILRFHGDASVNVLPAAAHDEGPVWWSNVGDAIDATLTYGIDLTGAEEPALEFRSWYEIEPWYDFGYVSVSADAGATWEALPTEHTITDDPVQVALGAGIFGRSGGDEEAAWVDDRVDLEQFAGQDILLRFEYVTDGSTHGRGWAVRDIHLEGAASERAVAPDAAGWMQLDAPIPQEYIVRLILTMEDGTVDVRDIALDDARSGDLPFNSDGVRDAVVAIAGATVGTTNTAPYRIELSR